MNFGNLKILARAYVPGAKVSVVSDSVLNLLLNQGVVEIAALTICLKANKKFNVVADQREYVLSSVVGDFLIMDDPGVYWYNGSSWKQLCPVTMKWLDENRPNWRDEDSGDPKHYYQESDTLGFHPTPDTSLASGFHVYYGKKPSGMTTEDQYPFGGEAEITHLSILSEAILYYWKWKILPALNKDGTDNFRLAERAFYNEITLKKAMLARRPDISASRYNQMQGTKIR